MTWNNRIFRHTAETKPGEWAEYYQIHEAFYNKKGKPTGWTDAMEPYGETPDELIEHLKQMLHDAERSKDDILDYVDDP